MGVASHMNFFMYTGRKVICTPCRYCNVMILTHFLRINKYMGTHALLYTCIAIRITMCCEICYLYTASDLLLNTAHILLW